MDEDTITIPSQPNAIHIPFTLAVQRLVIAEVPQSIVNVKDAKNLVRIGWNLDIELVS